MNRSFIVFLGGLLILSASVKAQRMQQKLGRGVVVTNRSGGRSVTSTAGTPHRTVSSW